MYPHAPVLDPPCQGGEADDLLMERVRLSRDAAAFRQLHDRHAGWLRARLVRLGVSDTDVDDVVQVAFWKVYRFAHRYQPRGRFCPWLRAVAKRVMLSYAASKRRYRRDYSVEVDFCPAATPEFGRDPLDDALAVAARIDVANDVMLATAQAGYRERKARGLIWCLPRLLHRVGPTVSEAAWLFPQIGRCVLANPAFDFFGAEEREQFLSGLGRLGEGPGSGNFRVDLAGCGLRLPASRVWAEFKAALADTGPRRQGADVSRSVRQPTFPSTRDPSVWEGSQHE